MKHILATFQLENTYDVWRVMAYLVIICTLSLLHHTKSLECRVCAAYLSVSTVPRELFID